MLLYSWSDRVRDGALVGAVGWVGCLGVRLDARDRLVAADEVADGDGEPNRAVECGDDAVLHLHRLDGDDRVARLDGVAVLGEHRGDGAGHGRAQLGVGGESAAFGRGAALLGVGAAVDAHEGRRRAVAVHPHRAVVVDAHDRRRRPSVEAARREPSGCDRDRAHRRADDRAGRSAPRSACMPPGRQPVADCQAAGPCGPCGEPFGGRRRARTGVPPRR